MKVEVPTNEAQSCRLLNSRSLMLRCEVQNGSIKFFFWKNEGVGLIELFVIIKGANRTVPR